MERLTEASLKWCSTYDIGRVAAKQLDYGQRKRKRIGPSKEAAELRLGEIRRVHIQRTDGTLYEETNLFPTICKDSKGVDEEVRCGRC